MIKSAPPACGVYYFFNKLGTIVYIGKSKSLKNRLASHLQSAKSPAAGYSKQQSLYQEACFAAYEPCESETAALLRECEQIKRYRPRYNSQLASDRKYPFIYISDGEYPQIALAYEKNKAGRYFGSFYSEFDANHAITLLNETLGTAFCQRSFEKPSAACLSYHIGKCLGPCEAYISSQGYSRAVNEAIDILSGKAASYINKATSDMLEHSEREEYALAAECRDKAAKLMRLEARAEKLNTDIASGSFAIFFRAYHEEAFTAFRLEGGKVTAAMRFSANKPPGKAEFLEFLSCRGDSFAEGLAKMILEIHADKYFVRLPDAGDAAIAELLEHKASAYLGMQEEETVQHAGGNNG
ncbi:MAG: GIY-YIG nuclease family protein [Eubacteriaceae bacterium]|nr:GIY-YIG nuclease family protein [Eubacteriaceae bacterium]